MLRLNTGGAAGLEERPRPLCRNDWITAHYNALRDTQQVLPNAPHQRRHYGAAHARRAPSDLLQLGAESSYAKVDTRWLVALALEFNRRSVSERRV